MSVSSAQLDWAAIRVLYLDFDGVLTDNKVWTDMTGNEMVRCDKYDSLGIAMLRDVGIETIVISKERSSVVQARCIKIQIACMTGVDEKLSALKQDALEKGFTPRQICYIGNDINDKECIEYAGIGVVTADTHLSVLPYADFVSSRDGGDGAIREVVDLILAHIVY